MKSNSNLSITDFKIDPNSQQISEIYINGEKLETGGSSAKLENYENTTSSSEEITPSDGFDGIKEARIGIYHNFENLNPAVVYNEGAPSVTYWFEGEPISWSTSRTEITDAYENWSAYVYEETSNGLKYLCEANVVYTHDMCGADDWYLEIAGDLYKYWHYGKE